MKRKLATFALALVFALPLPVSSMAAGHDGNHGAAMHDGGHDMKMDNASSQDTVTVDGVVAAIHLYDRREAMSKAGMEATHHLMMFFTKQQDDSPLADGAAAVKVTLPSGEELAAKKMMAMGNGFGVDLTLKEPGTYTFTVGTKLADGQKRQFEFQREVK